MLLPVAAIGLRAQQIHELKLAPDNVHWVYHDARVKPVLTIASGDRVRVETMAARGLERLRLAGAAESEIPESLKAVEAAVTTRGPGAHPLTGPIFVSGAEPGDSLEVRIGDIEFLHPYGVIGFLPGGGTTSLATTMQVVLHKKKQLRFARIETATHIITVGLDPDLDEAARIATREMVDYLVTEKRLSRDDAYTLCSAAVDLRVSQVVDVTKGVHAMLARSLFQ